jgi:hypothetical protein
MTQPDTLIDSYRAAQKLQEKLQDSAGPSELTRRRILAHAEQLATNKPSQDDINPSDNTTDLIAKEAIKTPAANDSQWKIRAFASVAVFGIAGLLMLQLSREAPDEFLPKAKPSASVERSTESATATIAEKEPKSSADKSAQAPVQAAAPAASAPAVAKPAVSLSPSTSTSASASASASPAPALKSTPLPEQRAKKSESASRDDLEVSAAKEPKQQNELRAEARADKAAEAVPSFAPPQSAAAPVSPAPAPAQALAPAAMADSAKLSRSAPVAPRATTSLTTNANAKLFSAIQSKDAVALKLALEGGDDKNAKNAAGTPALSLCVQSEQLNLLRLLIADGADVNALDARGVSPLAHARNRGFADIVDLLLVSGAK